MRIFVHAYSALPYLERHEVDRSLSCTVDTIIGSASLAMLMRLEKELPGMRLMRSPIHLMVPLSGRGRSGSWFASHCWTKAVPPGSFYRVGTDVFLSTPEFCFLQLSSKMTRIELIRLGCELCSTYRLNPHAQRGFETRPPLTTKDRLARYLETASEYVPVGSAAATLPWICENSASPRETVTAMLCSLPAELGGWNLGMPILNYPVETPGSRRYIDLYWPDRRFGLEYDSDSEHADGKSISRDSLREKEIELEGIRLARVTNRELSGIRERAVLHMTLCKGLGKRYTENPSEMTAFLQRRLATTLLAPHQTMV